MRHDPLPDWRETTPADRLPFAEPVRPTPRTVMAGRAIEALVTAAILVGLIALAFVVPAIFGGR